MHSSKFILGSANFGSRYGFKKKTTILKKEVNKILEFCKKKGINTIDTAYNYKNSEKLIGSFNKGKLKIITKLPKIKKKKNLKIEIMSTFENSLKRLRIKKIYCLLVHDTPNFFLLDPKSYSNSIIELKRRGLVKKIGFSVYYPEEVSEILKFIKPDIIQIPYNIFDRRFEKNNLLQKLKRKKIEIHARSIFLQGLIFRSTNKLPKFFKRWEHIFKKRDSYIKKNNLSYLDLALSFVKKNKHISKIVIGIDSLSNLIEIVSSKKVCRKHPNLTSKDLNLLIPYRWALR